MCTVPELTVFSYYLNISTVNAVTSSCILVTNYISSNIYISSLITLWSIFVLNLMVEFVTFYSLNLFLKLWEQILQILWIQTDFYLLFTVIVCLGLKRHGLTCNDVDFLVCTHGHSDHIGNNNLFLKAKHVMGGAINFKDVYDINSFKTG